VLPASKLHVGEIMDSKIWWGRTLPIGCLQQGSMAERLTKFYAMFGVSEQEEKNGRWRVWSPEEITILIGTGRDPNNPTRREIENMKRVRRRLVTDGALQKVQKMDYCDNIYRYSWRHTPIKMPEAALAVLNRQSGKVTWCNREDVLHVQWSDQLDTLPKIANWSQFPNEESAWQRVLWELLDFDNPEVWAFWIEKAPKAINGKGHPLIEIHDRDYRLMVALLAMEKGFKRNLHSNAGWIPRKPIGFALHALSKQVGRDSAWTLEVQEYSGLESEFKSADRELLRGIATESLRRNTQGATSSPSLDGEAGVQPPHPHATRPSALDGRRLAIAGIDEPIGELDL
jgi:hypothetical protein